MLVEADESDASGFSEEHSELPADEVSDDEVSPLPTLSTYHQLDDEVSDSESAPLPTLSGAAVAGVAGSNAMADAIVGEMSSRYSIFGDASTSSSHAHSLNAD